MLDVASRAAQMVETKTIRRVRTEAGVRRYKQPIGSIIIADSLLVGLTDKGTIKVGGRDHSLVEGANGKTYSIGLEKRQGREIYVARERNGDSNPVIDKDLSELEVYARLAVKIQAEAGIDTSKGGMPGSSRRREGWSANQIEAISGEISMWGNTATDTGNSELANELWAVADRIGSHRDARVTRHELEQMKKRRDLRLDEHANGDPSDETYGEMIDGAIYSTVSEGKLRKSYDEEGEAAYTTEVVAEQASRGSKPRPIKTSEIERGQWIRSTDKEGNPLGDWVKVTSTGEQSATPGRSRLIDGVERSGKPVRFYRQGPRNYWETVDDASNQPAYVPPAEPAPENVSKPVHRLREKDFTTIAGTDEQGNPVTVTGFVQNEPMYAKDDFSKPEYRRNPVYPVDISDDKAGRVNKRRILVPKGTMSGPQAEEAVSAPSMPTSGNGWNEAPSEYDGYTKYALSNGRAVYADTDDDGTDLYDEEDNLLGQYGPGDVAGVTSKLDELSSEPTTSSAETGGSESWEVPGYPNLRESVSEYDGYQKFSTNTEDFYLQRSGRTWTAYDKDDNEIVNSTGANARRSVLDILDKRGAEAAAAASPGQISTPAEPEAPKRKLRRKSDDTIPTGLTRMKDEFAGWKRYKMPNGKVIDVGQATEDDNRWYATGKGGWDDIVTDGDDEAEVMAKLGVMNGIEQPVSFAPGNTDNNKPISYTEEWADKRAEDLKRQWRNSQSPTQRALSGNPMTASEMNRLRAEQRQGGASRRASESRDFWKGGDADRVPFKAADVERAEEQAEKERDEAMMREAAEKERIRRSAASGNTINIKPGTAADIGQSTRNPGPILGAHSTEMAATIIGNEADYNADKWSGGAVVRAREVRDRLRDGSIDTPEAARRLRVNAASMEMGPVDNRREVEALRELADRIMSNDTRTQAQIREDAKAKRAAAAAVPSVQGIAALERLSSLNTEGVVRNGKPLSKADARVLNLDGTNRQASPGRLLPPNNRNMMDRIGRLTTNDAEGYQALENRATNNYLNGATQAAAWKEAIEAAESIKVPEHYVQQEGTRNGYGQHVVYRRNEDGKREEVMTFSGGPNRASWKQRELAMARMSQENIRARNAATRSVPVAGAPGPYVAPEKPSPAATAPATVVPVSTSEARKAEIQSNALMAYESMVQDGGWIHVSELRERLSQNGYSKAEQDDALMALSRSGQLNFAPDPDRMRISSDRRMNGLMLGGEMNHLVARGNTTPKQNFVPGSPAAMHNPTGYVSTTPRQKREDYKRDYERGWRDSARPNRNLENADQRNEPEAYYDGWSDYSVGVPKWSTAKDKDAYDAAATNPRVRIDEVRAAFNADDQVNPEMSAAEIVGKMQRNGLYFRPSEIQEVLDEGKRRKQATAEANTGVVGAADPDIQAEAETITEARARALARLDPGRFMRVVATRYFRTDGTFRNVSERDAYDEMMGYAEALDAANNAGSKAGLRGAVQSVLMSMKLTHSGMMGASRTMMTIYKVLDEENR
jgi:hypothetical protein